MAVKKKTTKPKPRKTRPKKEKPGRKAAAKVSSKADDLRAKSPDELADQLVKLRKEQFNLRFQKANGQLEKTSRVRVVRREIARINTILNEQRRVAAQG